MGIRVVPRCPALPRYNARAMAARVILDYQHPYVGRRLREAVAGITGAILVIIGTVAWLVVIPLSLLALGWMQGEDITLELGPGRAISPDPILAAWAISATCILLRFRGTGLRLVRGSRTSVLFLRRFGYSEATRAVTFAVTRTIGRTWRLITLDDAATAPLGIAPGTKWFFLLSHRLALVMGAPFKLLRLYPLALMGVWIVIGFELIRALVWNPHGETLGTALSPYGEILDTTFSPRLPFEALRFNLPGVFAGLMIVMFWPLVLLPPVFAAAPVWAWGFAFVFFAYIAFSMDVIRSADSARSREIRNEIGILGAIWAVREASRKLVAPRLMVLRVATDIWRETVSQLALATSVALIDVSEPSENLLWEIETLTLRTRTRCVFIGEYNRVAPLAGAAGTSAGESSDRQLASLLEHAEILAYTTDRRGRRRFARALRGKLLSVTSDRRASIQTDTGDALHPAHGPTS